MHLFCLDDRQYLSSMTAHTVAAGISCLTMVLMPGAWRTRSCFITQCLVCQQQIFPCRACIIMSRNATSLLCLQCDQLISCTKAALNPSLLRLNLTGCAGLCRLNREWTRRPCSCLVGNVYGID